MASKLRTIGFAVVALAIWPLPQASAQRTAPRPPVNEVCCYQEKPRCESTCPIMDAEQRESCLRDCEGRLRECLTQGAFVPKHGQNVICVRR
jgi:hypothetical protein